MRKRLLFGTLILIAMSMTASAQAQCPLEARVSRIEGRLDELTYAVETLVDRLTPEKDRGSMAPLRLHPRSVPTPATRGDAASGDETELQISNLQRRVAGLIEIARRQKTRSVGALSLRHRDQLADLESQVDLLETLLTGDEGGGESRAMKSLALLCPSSQRASCCKTGNCVRLSNGSCQCAKGRYACSDCQNVAGNACPP